MIPVPGILPSPDPAVGYGGNREINISVTGMQSGDAPRSAARPSPPPVSAPLSERAGHCYNNSVHLFSAPHISGQLRKACPSDLIEWPNNNEARCVFRSSLLVAAACSETREDNIYLRTES